ncbi:MAG: Hsp20/alpha crystallin family protein [Thermodesulfobacteriota bacterium]
MTIRELVPCSFRSKRLPVRHEEYSPFSLLDEGMDRLFEDFFGGFYPAHFQIGDQAFDPKVNISETEKEFIVSAELPGIDEKDLDVSITRDTLTINGEKKEEDEEKGKNYYRTERSYGSFSKNISLPEEVDLDKTDARFKKGVLRVTLPKTAKAIKEKRKIAINAETN